MGSRKESVPPSTWTESGLTPVLPESSSSRFGDGPDLGAVWIPTKTIHDKLVTALGRRVPEVHA